MSISCVSGSVSKDFPLYHSDRIPIYTPLYNFQHPRRISKIRITYSNEHPDIFRLKVMKEGGYRNPFLNNIENIDREEYLKKIENSKKKIKLIDFIKSSRKTSQDPNILNLIKNDQYIRKRKIENTHIKIASPRSNFSLSLDKKNIINKALKSLNKDKNRFGKNYIGNNIDFNQTVKIGDNYIINKNDINKLKKISCSFDINKSSNTGNSNDYNISDAQIRHLDKEINYPRKPIRKLNPITNTNQILYPPPFKFQKWGTFPTNYFILSNTKRGFSKKGGLFTELVNKNIDKIQVIRDDAKRKLKLKNENEKIEKEKFFQIINNYDLNQLNQINYKFNSLTPSNSMNNILIGKKFKELFSDKDKNTTRNKEKINNNYLLKNFNSYDKLV